MPRFYNDCLTVLVCAICAVVPTHTRAQDARQLLEACTHAVRYFNQEPQHDRQKSSWCLGYVQGYDAGQMTAVLEHNRVHNSTNTRSAAKDLYCDPPGVSWEQKIRLIVTFLQNNPQDLHFPASFVTFQILRISFPCDEPTRK